MQIHLGSKHLAADVAVALDAHGQQHLVVAAKATWSLPLPGQRPRPLAPQPLVLADEYHGEPGQSPMRYGADMARFKARCDVLFDACAHSPDGRSVTELLAGFELGEQRKFVRVLGARRWRKQLVGWGLSDPQPFTTVPLHHGLALGGTRVHSQDGQPCIEAHLHNPAGRGWGGEYTLDQLNDQPAPQLEHPDRPVTRPDAPSLPQALSAIGRHWLPRRQFAGTYDDAWRRDVFPLLPSDFDEQFHQCAPADQQVPYPQGGDAVRLLNLLPGQADLRFKLPRFKPLVRVLRTDYSQEAPTAVLDTLYFETERQRFSGVWRASVPIRRSLQEIADVAVGPVDPLWWRDRTLGRKGVGCRSCGDDEAPPVMPGASSVGEEAPRNG